MNLQIDWAEAEEVVRFADDDLDAAAHTVGKPPRQKRLRNRQAAELMIKIASLYT